MIPFLQNKQTTTQKQTSYYEYYIDFENDNFVGEKVYGNEAIKVWIYKALKTKRYVHDIYTWDFGQELESLIGQGYNKGYIDSEAIRMITETLQVNDKVKRCYNFEIELLTDTLHISFIVDTIFGTEEVVFSV